MTADPEPFRPIGDAARRDAARRAGEYQRWLDEQGYGKPQALPITTNAELVRANERLRAEVARLTAIIEQANR